MPAAPEVLSVNQVVLGLLVSVATSAFTLGGLYAAFNNRLKRSEECHAELKQSLSECKTDLTGRIDRVEKDAEDRMDKSDARFEAFKAQREALTEQWREDTRKRDVRDAELARDLKHLTDMVVALCDKARVPL